VQLVPLHPKRRPAWDGYRGAVILTPDFNAPIPEIEKDFEPG
jgi:hypothetical protein